MSPMKWHSECIDFMGGGGGTAILLVPDHFPFLRNTENALLVLGWIINLRLFNNTCSTRWPQFPRHETLPVTRRALQLARYLVFCGDFIAFKIKKKKKSTVVTVHGTWWYRGSGGIAPSTLNLDTKWRWVFKLTPRLLDPWERTTVPTE